MSNLLSEIMFFLLKGFLVFASTNIDDLVLLIIFLRTNTSKINGKGIILSQYLSFIVLIGASVLLSLSRLILPLDEIGLLGLIPIFLGIRKLRTEKLSRSAQNHFDILTMTVLSLGDGLDNITTYTALFVSETPTRICFFIMYFLFLLIIWYLVGSILARTRVVTSVTKKIKQVVPFAYIVLGVVILYENKTYVLLFNLILLF